MSAPAVPVSAEQASAASRVLARRPGSGSALRVRAAWLDGRAVEEVDLVFVSAFDTFDED